MRFRLTVEAPGAMLRPMRNLLLALRSPRRPRLAPLLLAVALSGGHALAELRVPAFTAYLDPQADGARVNSSSGISGWKGPALKVLWFGDLRTAGRLESSLVLRLPAKSTSRLRLTVAGQSHEVTAKSDGSGPTTVHFGSFEIAAPGYQRFTLESLNEAGQANGDFEALVLDGPAVEHAHFNLKPRRNAASVHLMYPLPKDLQAEAFYCEMTALDEPLWSYYMACGWHRGYFGMQINSPSERRIIFSVWDSGHEAVDRNRVATEDRVALVAKGEGVVSGDFGNEGTGGHSHWVYPWKTGQTQRFVVTAKPTDATHTIYSGYYFHPEKRQWMLISSWRAPKEGGYLRGLYSFSENFGGSNGHLRRKARYGNQWVRTPEGRWVELTTATFSHDPTGRADRLDRFMGVEQGRFFLSHGGFVPGFTAFGEKFERLATGKAPSDVALPEPAMNPLMPAVAADALAQNQRLGRGVNIIGWDALWRERARGHFKDEHFKLIRQAGFSHVRVNLHPLRDGQPDAQGKLRKEFFTTLDWALDQALANHLLVVLDFHDDLAISPDPAGKKSEFLASWAAIAVHCRERPPEVLFELLNEPAPKFTHESWADYWHEALAVIRKSNPARTVIIGPDPWNGFKQLASLHLPEEDRNLIVTFHYYDPFEFTHQGTPWTGQRDKTGVSWQGTEKERQRVEQDFDQVQAWARQQRRPIYLGEFGAYEKGDMDSRARWTACIARQAEKRGWSWAYWQFAGDFVLFDMSSQKWVEPIRRALMPDNSAPDQRR